MADIRPAEAHNAAVRNLLAWSQRCVAGEREIQARYDELSEAIEVQHRRVSRRLQRRRDRLRAAIQEAHDARAGHIEQTYESELQKLDKELEAARETIADEFTRTHQAAKKELDHAVWTAESIYDAEKEKLARQEGEIEAQCESFNKNLEVALQQAGRLVKRWGQPELIQVTRDGPKPSDGRPTEQVMAESWRQVEEGLSRLQRLALPPWFEGVTAPIVGLLLWAGCATGALAWQGWQPTPQFITLAVASAVVIVLVLFAMSRWSRKQVRDTFLPMQEAGFIAREASEKRAMDAALYRKEKTQERRQVRDEAVKAARERLEPTLAEVVRRRDARLAQVDEKHRSRLARRAAQREELSGDANAKQEAALRALQDRYDRYDRLARERQEGRLRERDEEIASMRRELEQSWRRAWDELAQLADRTRATAEKLYPAWDDDRWRDWQPRLERPRVLPFGSVRIDPRRAAESPAPAEAAPAAATEEAATSSSATAESLPFELPSAPIDLPALIDMPAAGSVLWQYGRTGREQAVAGIQAVVARLLTALPPGQVRLTILDPVGLGQTFAGFMHLVDYQEELVGARIWTGADQIEQRLIDLTEHMENVIQKYLRNEYESIDQYNEKAGELAEPYRFLVINDFPANFSEPSAARLRSILSSGARCGVYTLITCDTTQPLPPGIDQDDLEDHSINLVWEDGRFVWKGSVYERFDLTLTPPPDEDRLTELMRVVGQAAREGNRVEVPFESIAPKDGQVWSGSSAKTLRVPIGKSGATRLQEMVLGRDVAQHALIAGKTGSGKSTLLHVMITNLALWYSPDEVEFYLIDFKKGVEFKAYATHGLPHARAVAVESDREFGLSVLQRLDAEITRRGDLYRKQGVQEINAYRQAVPDAHMPRVLLIIDEFQEFFSEDDKIAQDAALLLDRLVRQGRAFGIHVILGSQTLAGNSNLPRSTIGQMAIRVALQCSDADSQLILGDNNSAARLLSRPGEAIYNDAGGLLEGNSPFQVSWLSDAQRDAALEQARERLSAAAPAPGKAKRLEPMIVFEGNAAANVTDNAALMGRLYSEEWPASFPGAPRVELPLGGAVAIKEPTSAILRRQSGSNVLVVGQQDEGALALTATSILSLASQLSPETCRFVVLDGTPADAPHADLLTWLVSQLPHPAKLVPWRDVPQAMDELAAEASQRQEDNQTNAPAVFTIVHGIQRYRMLRRSEDDFSFSMSDEPKKPKPDKQFGTLLREGAPVGMHTLVWCDSYTTLERTLDRQAMKEFDNRVLFQMSANDSSNLIDSPAASQLGFYRAIFANDERGLLEKFRPYGLPERHWLEEAVTALRKKVSVATRA